MKYNVFQMGFEIKTNNNIINQPTQFIPWTQENHSPDYPPTSTLKYMNDALIGMNYHVLNQFKNLPQEDVAFVQNHLKAIDPYFELYQTASLRLAPIQKAIDHKTPAAVVLHFEREFSQFIDQCFSSPTVQLKFIGEALRQLNTFEESVGRAFLYNFDFQFSAKFTQKLISFYSFLFHIRTIVAMNHNNQIEDTTFESLRCDSVNDYLPKTDFTVNDALLYWQFKKLATPFVGVPDIRIEKLLVQPLEQAFFKFNHNAWSLINNLPESFMTFHNSIQLEDELHQIQVDWLMGSSCGLLFRLREEFYGLQHGYDKIFWPEATENLTSPKNKKNVNLQFCFELYETDFITTQKTA